MIASFIHDPMVIQRILKHLELWASEPMQRGPPQDAGPADSSHWPSKAQLPLEYVPVPDIARALSPPLLGRAMARSGASGGFRHGVSPVNPHLRKYH